MNNTTHPLWSFAALILIGAVVFLCYFPALDGGFVYDDPLLILDNPFVTQPDAGVFDVFKRPYFGAGGGGSGYYRPMMPLLFRMEYKLYGGKPSGFHLDNLLIHWGVCSFIFLFLAGLGASRGGALAAGLLFAAHPVTTESIAWISGRTDPLAFLFMGMALLLLVRYLGRLEGSGSVQRRGLLFFLCLLFYLAALLVKEIAIILPIPVLVMLILMPPSSRQESSRRTGRTILITGAFVVLALLVLVAGRLLPRGDEADLFTGRGGVLDRGLTFLSVLPAYMGKVFCPTDLSLARPVALVTTVFDLRVALGLLILVAAAGILVLGFRKKNLPCAIGAALFLPAILVHSNVVPIAYSFKEMDFPFFERYLYIPMAALLLIIGGLLPRGKGRLGFAIPLAAALVLCLFLGKATLQRTRVWHDNTSLFMASLESYPDSPTLSFNLGQAFFETGRLMEAQAAFHRAYYLDPDMDMARVHEAVVLSDFGRFDEAEKNLLEVIRKNPENGQALEAMGFIQAQAMRWGKALEYYARATLQMEGVESTLGSRNRAAMELKTETEALYVEGKDYSAVLARADLALEWLPDSAWAHEARGLALLELGEEAAAIEALEKAVALDETESALGMSKLVMIYRREGRTREAEILAGKLKKILDQLPPPEALQESGNRK